MPSNVGMEVRQGHKNVYQQTFSDERERVDDVIDQSFEDKYSTNAKQKRKNPRKYAGFRMTPTGIEPVIRP